MGRYLEGRARSEDRLNMRLLNWKLATSTSPT